jgi:flavin-dependent dehydrogenase
MTLPDNQRPDSSYDVTVIGAGPAGTITAALLKTAGLNVAVFERSAFPRFVIGESLLPICNDVLTEAKLFDRVQSQGYQVKTGAVFLRGEDVCEFDFSQQFTDGTTWTWQVPRADFDNVLANGIQALGVPIFFEHGVTDVEVGASPQLSIEASDGTRTDVQSQFIVDASGYGRVLPRLLDLDSPSDQPTRRAIFTHVTGDKRPTGANSGRIWAIIHRDDVWIWIIPFADGRTSVGVVAPQDFYDTQPDDPETCFRAIIESNSDANGRLSDTDLLFEPLSIENYSIGIKQLFGEGYCIVGNATEFLDPIFSSGVALAMQSASQASKLIIRQFGGESVDWQAEYADFMARGIDTFRSFVNAWYDGTLHDIFFASDVNPEMKSMICSALAGYVWDLENPFVRNHDRKLRQLRSLVREAAVA